MHTRISKPKMKTSRHRLTLGGSDAQARSLSPVPPAHPNRWPVPDREFQMKAGSLIFLHGIGRKKNIYIYIYVCIYIYIYIYIWYPPPLPPVPTFWVLFICTIGLHLDWYRGGEVPHKPHPCPISPICTESARSNTSSSCYPGR